MGKKFNGSEKLKMKNEKLNKKKRQITFKKVLSVFSRIDCFPADFAQELLR